MAAHKKTPGAVFNNACVGPKGERHGWQRIKNRLERFLTTQRVGLKGKRHGWQRIKKRRERFLTTQRVGLKGKRHGRKNKKTSRSWFFSTHRVGLQSRRPINPAFSSRRPSLGAINGHSAHSLFASRKSLCLAPNQHLAELTSPGGNPG